MTPKEFFTGNRLLILELRETILANTIRAREAMLVKDKELEETKLAHCQLMSDYVRLEMLIKLVILCFAIAITLLIVAKY